VPLENASTKAEGRASDAMPIPAFDNHGVLPPYSGDLKKIGATSLNATSPYPATTIELCKQFATCPARRTVLKGYLAMRALMHQLEWVDGFQWVDGAFLEKDGKRNGKAPDHIQVVTFSKDSALLHDPAYTEQFRPIRTRKSTRATFSVDHALLNLEWPLLQVIDHTRHWGALLSHQREEGIWKGLLKIDLNTIEDDAAALSYLETLGRS
jgi:hypothetical protein